MQRKHFLAAAGALGAVLGAGIASGASYPVAATSASPGPSASPYWRRGERGSLHSLEHAHRAIGRIIDRLQHDQTDYGGHRVAAVRDLQQAQSQIAAAIEYDKSHPNTAT